MIEFDESDLAKTYRGRAQHARAAAQDKSINIGDLKFVLERLADEYEAKAAAYELARQTAGYAGDSTAGRISAA